MRTYLGLLFFNFLFHLYLRGHRVRCFRTRLRVDFWFHHSLNELFTSLCLRVPICTMGIVTVPASQDCSEDLIS